MVNEDFSIKEVIFEAKLEAQEVCWLGKEDFRE
jgi:hypothetical protein